jgi:hypothetical protein
MIRFSCKIDQTHFTYFLGTGPTPIPATSFSLTTIIYYYYSVQHIFMLFFNRRSRYTSRQAHLAGARETNGLEGGTSLDCNNSHYFIDSIAIPLLMYSMLSCDFQSSISFFFETHDQSLNSASSRTKAIHQFNSIQYLFMQFFNRQSLFALPQTYRWVLETDDPEGGTFPMSTSSTKTEIAQLFCTSTPET